MLTCIKTLLKFLKCQRNESCGLLDLVDTYIRLRIGEIHFPLSISHDFFLSLVFSIFFLLYLFYFRSISLYLIFFSRNMGLSPVTETKQSTSWIWENIGVCHGKLYSSTVDTIEFSNIRGLNVKFNSTEHFQIQILRKNIYI